MNKILREDNGSSKSNHIYVGYSYDIPGLIRIKVGSTLKGIDTQSTCTTPDDGKLFIAIINDGTLITSTQWGDQVRRLQKDFNNRDEDSFGTVVSSNCARGSYCKIRGHFDSFQDYLNWFIDKVNKSNNMIVFDLHQNKVMYGSLDVQVE